MLLRAHGTVCLSVSLPLSPSLIFLSISLNHQWVDKRGHWHALLHKMNDGTGGLLGSWSGGHIFSSDGTSWSSQARAYNTTALLPGGATEVFARRERPKLLANTDGEWAWIYHGVVRASNKPEGTYTAVAALEPKVTNGPLYSLLPEDQSKDLLVAQISKCAPLEL